MGHRAIPAVPGYDLTAQLARRVIGQPAATAAIAPYVAMFRANLARPNRPVGVFLLLGPSGTGKTKTVEALAGILHHDERKLLRIDCGEFQKDHEIAKLTGAPPGYLGHSETAPRFTQDAVDKCRTQWSKLSIVLFDEIEKASEALRQLLLGLLDIGEITTSSNKRVSFESSMIFLTSNLGGREMRNSLNPAFGFSRPANGAGLAAIGVAAARKAFSPEFMGRIDATISYAPLDAAMIGEILNLQLAELQRHIRTRLGDRAFPLDVSKSAKAFLIAQGSDTRSGARELKRTLDRHLYHPMIEMLDAIPRGATLRVDLARTGDGLRLRAVPAAVRAAS